MNYNFIKIKPWGNYLTIIDPTNTPRYMCFSNNVDAMSCISYLSTFRSKHGFFPRIDLSKPNDKHRIESIVSKPRKPSYVANFLSIESVDQYELDYVCSKNSIGFFYVHSFGYILKNNELQLLLSAQELNSEPNAYRYIKNLDDIYNKN